MFEERLDAHKYTVLCSRKVAHTSESYSHISQACRAVDCFHLWRSELLSRSRAAVEYGPKIRKLELRNFCLVAFHHPLTVKDTSKVRLCVSQGMTTQLTSGAVWIKLLRVI